MYVCIYIYKYIRFTYMYVCIYMYLLFFYVVTLIIKVVDASYFQQSTLYNER